MASKINKTRKPHALVRFGSASVRVFRQRVGKYRAFEVRYKLGTKVIRKVRASEAEALALANSVAEAMGSGRGIVEGLTDADASAYRRAMEIIRQTGVPLEVVAAEWLAEWKRKQDGAGTKLVRDAVEEYLHAKKLAGLSKDHFGHLRGWLWRFAAAFNVPLAGINAADLNRWLATCGAARTVFNIRSSIASLVNYSKAAGWVPQNWNIMDAVTVGIKVPPVEHIYIYTVEEMRRVLECAAESPKLLPFIGLAAFAGLRHSEIAKLDWSAVRDTHIVVGGGIAKTAVRRIVPMLPALAAIVGNASPGVGRVCPAKNMTKRLRDCFASAKVEFHRNALRHSFISYRVAQTQNVAQVALEAGNSPTIIFRHYRELVTPEMGEKWFNLVIKSS